MKTVLTILLSAFFLTSATANNSGDIKIGPNGKTSFLELRMQSKKASVATITILNANGVVVSTQTANLVRGKNNLAMVDIASLEEGMYKVTLVSDKKTHTAQFMNWR